jgi:hypothetical protein
VNKAHYSMTRNRFNDMPIEPDGPYEVVCDDGYWMIQGPGFLPLGYAREDVVQLRDALTAALRVSAPDDGNALHNSGTCPRGADRRISALQALCDQAEEGALALSGRDYTTALISRIRAILQDAQ